MKLYFFNFYQFDINKLFCEFSFIYICINCIHFVFYFILLFIFIPIFTSHHIEKNNHPKDEVNIKLNQFIKFIKDLKDKGLLDGDVLIAKKGEILLHQSAYRSSFNDEKDTQFYIGSVSKQFFAVALLKSLYDSSIEPTEELKIADVKLKLNLPLSHFLPKNAAIWEGKMPAWAEEVTLHQLLSHTSGIPNFTDSPGFRHLNRIDGNMLWFESRRSSREIIDLIIKEPLLFTPGSKFSYSNTGFVIIADVIEAITSQTVSQYLQKNLFDPLELTSTASPKNGKWEELKFIPKLFRLAPPMTFDLKGNQNHLYLVNRVEDISTANGAGSIISSVSDLLKWNQALHVDKKILPKELYHLFINPILDDYAYGIGLENTESFGLVLGHTGGISSYRSFLFYIPEHEISIVVLSNVSFDFEKIEVDYRALSSQLGETIRDEAECNQTAFKMILQKYPISRGFDLIEEEFEKFLH